MLLCLHELLQVTGSTGQLLQPYSLTHNHLYIATSILVTRLLIISRS
jgi:hypothetical protein